MAISSGLYLLFRYIIDEDHTKEVVATEQQQLSPYDHKELFWTIQTGNTCTVYCHHKGSYFEALILETKINLYYY